MRAVVKRHKEAGINDRLPGFLDGALHWLRFVLREDQVFGVFGVTSDHLPHEAAVRRGDHQVDAVGALTDICTRAKFPRWVDRLHFNVVSIRALPHSELAARHRHDGSGCNEFRRGAILCSDTNGDGAADHWCLAFHLRSKVDHAADDQHDDAGVNHPDAKVHYPQRNTAHGGSDQRERNERHQYIKRPPMEPFEFSHLKRAPLAHLRVHPCVRMEDVWMNRVQDARRPNRHVRKEKNQQHNAKANAAEEVEDWSDQGVHSG